MLSVRLASSPRLHQDVSGLAFADLSAVRELFLAARDLPAGGRITLAGAQPVVRGVIELGGFRRPQMLVR